MDLSKVENSGQITKKPVRDYAGESYLQYHQFVNPFLGKDNCTAPFSYSTRLTDRNLIWLIAEIFLGKKLNWNNKLEKFKELEVKKFLDFPYVDF